MKGQRFLNWIYIVICLIFIDQSIQAQQFPSNINRAEHFYQNREYAKALYFFLKENFKENKRNESNLVSQRIANCYRLLQEFKEAETWYQKLNFNGTITSEDRFSYAETLQQNGKYINAIKQYLLTHPKSNSDQQLIERRIYSCEISDSLMHIAPYFTVKNDTILNSKYAEFGLIPYGKGHILISDKLIEKGSEMQGVEYLKEYGRTNRGYLHLFYKSGEMENSFPWLKFDSIFRSDFHIGPLVFNQSENLVFFTVSDPKKRLSRLKPKDPSITKLKIYFARKIKGIWSSPTLVQIEGISNYSFGHPALSQDEKLLYFTSDMPGGMGGLDLYYVSILDNYAFGKPINLGKTINTEGDESFPVFQPNGDFYFSSEGHPGLGGLDVFRTRGEKTQWLIPQNLGYPVNSSNDDFSMLAQGRDSIHGYFSSNRLGGKGSDDIYQFTQIVILPSLKRMAGDTLRKDSSEADLVQKKEFPLDNLPKLFVKNPLNEKKPDDSILLRNKRLADFLRSGEIHHLIKPGNKFNSYLLDSAALRDIDSTIRILKAHPELKMKIIGHTDSRGNDKYNLLLSKKRAQAVFNRMVSEGIDSKRLTTMGVGSSNLVNRCRKGVKCSEAEHAENRKTQLIIENIGDSFALTDKGKVISTDTTLLANRLALEEIIQKNEINRLKRLRESNLSATKDQNLNLGNLKIQKLGIIQTLNEKDEALKSNQDAEPNHNDLLDAFSEMTIDSIYLTPRNLLVIRETDKTVQRIFLPESVLKVDQHITDLAGHQWLIRRDRKVIHLRDKKR